MNITLDRAVIEQALEALNYVMRHGPAVQKAKDILQDALAQPEQEPGAWAGVDFSIGCTPPQRKPLTEEEIWKIYGLTGLGNGMAARFARAIEAAHGIKEGE